MATARGRGPSAESLREQYDHDYQHRGDSGMFGSFFTEDVDEWVPADGENEVAIVQYKIKDNGKFRSVPSQDFNLPVAEKWLSQGEGWVYKLTILMHGNVGPNKDRVVCPRTLKLPCPICELHAEVRDEVARLKSQNRADKELEDRMMQFRASKKAVYNIISFNSKKDRERGVMVWVAPHASIQDVVITRQRDKRTGQVKHFGLLAENWNVCFTKTGKGLNTEYTEVDLLDRRKEDMLSAEEEERALKQAWVLDEIVEVKPYDDLYEMVHGVKPGRKADAEKEPEEDRPRGRGRTEEARPQRESGRGGREPVVEKEEEAGDQKECFAAEFNQRAECEDCESEIFKACMKASDEAARGASRAAPPERGSEDRSSRESRPSRGGGSRSSR